MTVEEIRNWALTATASENSQGAASVGDCAFFLREIAAQLAEVNAHLHHNQGRGKITNPERCLELGETFWCSLPKGHIGQHKAYEDHDLTSGVLEKW